MAGYNPPAAYSTAKTSKGPNYNEFAQATLEPNNNAWQALTADLQNNAIDSSRFVNIMIELKGPGPATSPGPTNSISAAETIKMPARLEGFTDEHVPTLETKEGAGSNFIAASKGITRTIGLKFKLVGFSVEECITNLYCVNKIVQWLYPRSVSKFTSREEENKFRSSLPYCSNPPAIQMRLQNLISDYSESSDIVVAKKNDRTKRAGINGQKFKETIKVTENRVAVGGWLGVIMSSFKPSIILDAGFITFKGTMVPKAYDIDFAARVHFDRDASYNVFSGLFSEGAQYPYGVRYEDTQFSQADSFVTANDEMLQSLQNDVQASFMENTEGTLSFSPMDPNIPLNEAPQSIRRK